MKAPTVPEIKDINDYLIDAASTLNNLKYQAAARGLFKTMHAIDKATKALGWEVAEKREAFGKGSDENTEAN